MRYLLTVICGFSVLVLGNGCAPQGSEAPDTTTKVTPVAFNSENAPTVEFNVPDMMCPDGCGEATRAILAEQNGVLEVKIDFPAKLAIVAIDREQFDAEHALGELVDKGFENSTVKKSADQ